MIEIISICLISLLLAQDLLLWILIEFNFKKYENGLIGNYPSVSILIPCRNESHNLSGCLSAMEKLHYPKEKLEIVVGNDQSEDGTDLILKNWSKKNHENFIVEYLEIKEGNIHQMNGKANALSQMAKIARGKVLLFTDADCIVPENWVESMVNAQTNSGAGMVTGITFIQEQTFFGQMQALDWWLTLGMVKVLDDLGWAVTSMGNNMLITRDAYESSGGFGGIPFSLTEDLEMARNIKKKGFKVVHYVSHGNLIETRPQKQFRELLRQRKRWISGAMSLPQFWKMILALQVLFFPAMIYLICLHPLEGLCLWIFKVSIQSGFLYSFANQTKAKLSVKDFFLFEIYYMITAWSTLVYYFWPSKTDWKGRRY